MAETEEDQDTGFAQFLETSFSEVDQLNQIGLLTGVIYGILWAYI